MLRHEFLEKQNSRVDVKVRELEIGRSENTGLYKWMVDLRDGKGILLNG